MKYETVQWDQQILTSVAQCTSPAWLTDTLEVCVNKTANTGTINSTVSAITLVGALETTHDVLRVATIIRSSVLAHFTNVKVIHLHNMTTTLIKKL